MYKAEILQIYFHYRTDNAPTIYENINAFNKYSEYNVISINANTGFPKIYIK